MEKINNAYVKTQNNRFSGGGGGKPSFPKKGERQKTDTQDFILAGEEKLETPFPVPEGSSIPHFQRAIGMVEGTILEANKKGNGVIEIEGIKYPLKENRPLKIVKRYPLYKYEGKVLKVSFYPTITIKGMKILKMKPTDPPFIKVSTFRKEITKQGAIEILGKLKFVNRDNFVVAIWSPSSKKEYVVTVFGKCNGERGEFVKVDAVLKEGLIQLENMRIFDV